MNQQRLIKRATISSGDVLRLNRPGFKLGLTSDPALIGETGMETGNRTVHTEHDASYDQDPSFGNRQYQRNPIRRSGLRLRFATFAMCRRFGQVQEFVEEEAR